jgi:CPA2 family monovalent cation:H+ antiporter-2
MPDTHDLSLLRELVLIVLVAIPVVLVTSRLRIPAVVGFLLTGMLIGPHTLRLIAEQEAVTQVAELGAVLLLFTVGLELSLSRILKLGREVLVGGTLQLTVTAGLVGGLLLALGNPPPSAVLMGALFALSSTAVVLKLYAERQDLDTPHGRVVVAILLFQDLAVVPLMLLLPILAGTAPSTAAAARDLLTSLAVVAVLIMGGRFAVPRLLGRLAKMPSRELFTLTIVALGLGAAYVTAQFGLSLALGAFLAGLVISESDYGLQALSDVLPFRDTFSGIFFISIGMLLDVPAVAREPALILGATAATIVVKVAVVAAVVAFVGYSLRTGIVAGMGLAQVGEFAFVLASAGLAAGVLTERNYQGFLAAAVLSMLLTPALIAVAEPVADGITGALGRPEFDATTREQQAVAALRDHVIVVGYGLNGRNLAKALRGARIPYVILEENARTVRRAREEGEPMYFGDGTRSEVLRHVGIEEARVIVYVIASASSTRRGVAMAHHLNPKVHIVVRTRYVAQIEDLQRLGATEVVPEEFETSLEIFSRVLRKFSVPSSAIRAEVEAVRKDHYDMFRGRERPYAGHLTDLAISLGVRIGVETVPVEHGAGAIGGNPRSLRLRQTTGATVVAVLRGKDIIYEPSPEFGFRDHDTVVLVGNPDALARAIPLFRAPAADGAPAAAETTSPG